MKAQVLENIQTIKLKDIPLSSPKEGELLIRVKACAICGTDLKVYHYGHHRVSFPRILGHEIAGEVVKAGAKVKELFPEGERIIVAPAIPCGECEYCRKNKEAMCLNLKAIGYNFDGGFAEYMIVPEIAIKAGCVNKLPSNLTFEEGALVEPLACVLNGQELMWVGEGDNVVIIGGGPLGILHARIAKAKKVNLAIILEISEERLKMLRERKVADYLFNPKEVNFKEKIFEITRGKGAERVIVACGSPEAQKWSLEITAPLGSVNFFGGLPHTSPFVNLNTNLIHYKQIYVVGTHGSSPYHNKKALDMLKKGEIMVKDVITHTLPLNDLLEGFRIMEEKRGLKVIIQP